MSRRARWIVNGIVLAAAAMYAAIGSPFDPFDNRRFSADVWRAAGKYDPDERARMCRDIIKRVILPGMSEEQVVTVLGRPDRIRDTRCPDNEPLTDRRLYGYDIGNWTFQRMDDAFLFVHLDRNDRVLKAEICGY